MPANLQPDTDLAAALFDRLRAATTDGLGVTRDAYGPGERIAHALVREAADGLGLETRADHAGNLLMTLPGADRGAKRIVLGSHLDSVREGGNYDGAAGVLAGLAAVAGMAHARFTPARDVTVVALRAEEAGQWFPTSYPGSHAALGTLPEAALQIARQDTGRSLADHMASEGFDPAAVRAGTRTFSPADTAAYLELHIEQGPVLDAEAVPIGIVTGIPGSRRYRSGRVVGEYNHSGATPRRYRRDAAIALAELAAGLDDAWGLLEQRGHRMVCTFCVLGTTAEAGFTKIPGEAVFQLDMRAVDPASLAALDAELHRLAAAVAARRGVDVVLGPLSGSKPSPMDAAIQAGLARAADAVGVRHMSMASGGGHDAAAFAQAGIPAGMLFVRNQNGSHNPAETMRRKDFDAACEVVLRWTLDTAG
jgi:N-carbamoyl-L-amino-acid hydrolase